MDVDNRIAGNSIYDEDLLIKTASAQIFGLQLKKPIGGRQSTKLFAHIVGNDLITLGGGYNGMTILIAKVAL